MKLERGGWKGEGGGQCVGYDERCERGIRKLRGDVSKEEVGLTLMLQIVSVSE